MNIYLECIPCFFKQAIEASRLSGANSKDQVKILKQIAEEISQSDLSGSPPEMGKIIYGTVKKITKVRDPYEKIKAKSNRLALTLYAKLDESIRHSKDSLLKAVQLAIAGNIIDYGVKSSLDIDDEIKKILKMEDRAIRNENITLFDFNAFKKAITNSKVILFIGDNAGEIVFDKLLIAEIKRRYKNKNIIYAVRGKPIINDALKADALQCGLHYAARIISSGLDIPGTVLSLCSKVFLDVYRRADMVISKGQGNFEALSDKNKDLFFLFMAKCPVVARHINCKIGDIILYRKKPKNILEQGRKMKSCIIKNN